MPLGYFLSSSYFVFPASFLIWSDFFLDFSIQLLTKKYKTRVSSAKLRGRLRERYLVETFSLSLLFYN